MPKAIHPLSVPDHDVGGEEQSKPGAILQKEPVLWDSTDNLLMDICELLEPKARPPNSSLHDLSKCGLCERLLSQRSPWCSCRIVCSGDLPTASVLSCRHVYHSECLEQTTPKVSKHDPPCPLCSKSDENTSDRRAVCRMRNGIPKLKSPEEGPSRLWSCAQAGDCVEGVLHAPKQSRMALLSKNHLKRQLSMKVNLTKKQSENLKRSGIRRQVGCSSSS
ncbi:uncharacterized protein LOC121970087 isoform X1 [Zingiber officinale]|uniref:uncharacterized protein LOC121970087 isoform X1 n=1 Tax=Zingiber officinale TaxID=94328 RepID=UPI001C4C0C8C|nr:uncharacterized protein LOC121970087 isoform X1 [Zingiber officinale]XP_042376442.1 uncharacterized protein LOC121970087 isoform X1 [Zingiber officinale]XP_042376445.1 uncharacterized protein LOC121970087 isoform X1 [Zingiber officinale]